ncbi:hypothetical protein ACFVGY_24095 [Streptomyces sp. NPDC127106]|uniref:hypothetical protein n=1 Tax=Streptomyces sp. NPDC127106 TaxID=3345360 RepID=UPI003628F465
MSLTDFRTARRDDQDAAADRALKAKKQQDESELLRKQQEFEQAQEAKDREARRQGKEREAKEQARLQEKQAKLDADLQARRERRRERAKKLKERRERIVAWINAAPKWISDHLDLASALAVMACSIIPALISQASSLHETGLVARMGLLGWLLVTTLPVMLELSAWAAKAGESKALRQKRSPWPYRIAVYLFASLAAAINYWHGLDIGGKTWGVALGSVLAASSIIPIVVFQLVELGHHRERREEMKAERQARKDAAETRKIRRTELPLVWATAVRLRGIAGYRLLSEEQAWHVAYGVYEGAVADELPEGFMRLLSTEMLGSLVEAEERRLEVLAELAALRDARSQVSAMLSGDDADEDLEQSAKAASEVLETLPTRVFAGTPDGLVEGSASDFRRNGSSQVNPSVPPSARTPKSAPPRTREAAAEGPKRKSVSAPLRKLSPAARRAAAETARNYDTSENKAIEEWICGEIRDGRIPKSSGVVAETMNRRIAVHGPKAKEPSKTWVYDRIAAAKRARTNSRRRA